MANREEGFLKFLEWWKTCKGDEKSEAQLFLEHLFQAFGHESLSQAGITLEQRIRSTGQNPVYADCVYPGIALIEMKKRGENLQKHYKQLENYWLQLTPKPTYALLCNFDEIWVYNFDRQMNDPLDKVQIADLPNRWPALAYLFPASHPDKQKIFFNYDTVQISADTAAKLAELYTKLKERKLGEETAQRFVLQCMVAFFAEDIGLLPRFTMAKLIDDSRKLGEGSYNLIAMLFHHMNRPTREEFGPFRNIPFFNGGLFAHVPMMALNSAELNILDECAKLDWAKINPSIFGTLFEQSMKKEERHRIGAHFTSERDIYAVIEPVIVRPWRQKIEAAQHDPQQLRHLQQALANYQVLDPACGSGNFLYLAYRELKRLEKSILDHLQALNPNAQNEFGLVSAKQFWGFDIKPFAVELAKVTLMIAKKLAIDELGLPENPLPLDDLNENIRCADALFTEWPPFDACIGNPPYMGAKRLKQEHPPQYINRIREAFPDISGNADYCVYWFYKAHQAMLEGGRAGLVGTNTIRQNFSRQGSLDYIVENGGDIFEATPSVEWSGEANVHVSIVCWQKGPSEEPHTLHLMEGQTLKPHPVPRISASLSPKTDVSKAKPLRPNQNPKRVFQGQIPGHEGFVLSPEKAHELVAKDLFSRQVIFPFMIGEDLLGRPDCGPSRYVIDFHGHDMTAAQGYRAAFKHLEETVLPDRKEKAAKEEATNQAILRDNPQGTVNHTYRGLLNQWWQQNAARGEMQATLAKMKRCIVCSRVSKRSIFAFISTAIRPDNALQVFAFEDDYSYGLLQALPHWEWFVAKSSTLRNDYRYTPHSVFETYPFPQTPSAAQVRAVAEAGRAILSYRAEALSRASNNLNLRELYRGLEKPGKNALRDLHQALDEAVLAAYGFKAGGDILKDLLDLNLALAEAIERGEDVQGPGIPANYPTPDDLISDFAIPAPSL